ncbi:carotenoid oxygenase [Leptolyngbya sp. 'hensonii']|uniref:HAD-IA family hydrolase n=1 Tax=Leptolyngbya sp. 'hensonii' TaxID=1922337 RepID=UPI00094F9989|nr:HAD-IA family hydrolase [Leptolyngbya sp. 'hensonii']OLP15837.1 carotenoid oxygenase [Leptolyngbya sp. 'hensonii']
MPVPPTTPIHTVIFDFDGTIADTLDVVVRIANHLAGEFGYEPVTNEQVKAFKHLSSRQIIQSSGVPLMRVPFLLRRVRTELKTEISTAIPIPGIPEVLAQLQIQGYHLGIATSNSRDNVLAFLAANQLTPAFDFIYSGLTLLGKGRLLKRILAKERLHPTSVVYVGDETRDIEAAKQVGVWTIAVAWGFNSREILTKHQPDYLIHHPQQLLEVLAQNGQSAR